ILTPITPRSRADGLRDNRGELACRVDRPALASLRNCSCNRLSKPFLTIVADDLREFVYRCARDELRRGFAARRVHAHVEGPLRAIRESAFGRIELRRRNPEVEQHAVDGVNAER